MVRGPDTVFHELWSAKHLHNILVDWEVCRIQLWENCIRAFEPVCDTQGVRQDNLTASCDGGKFEGGSSSHYCPSDRIGAFGIPPQACGVLLVGYSKITTYL